MIKLDCSSVPNNRIYSEALRQNFAKIFFYYFLLILSWYYQNSKPQSNLMIRPFLTRKRLSLRLMLIWQTKIELLHFSFSYSVPWSLFPKLLLIIFIESVDGLPTKGQLISKANTKLFIWTKKNNENIFVFLS